MKPIANEVIKLRFAVGDTVEYLRGRAVFEVIDLLLCMRGDCRFIAGGECDGFRLVDELHNTWAPCPGELRRVDKI